MLDIRLTVYTGPSATETTVELLVPMPSPMMGTFPVAATGDRSKASITLKLDTALYGSKAGGTISITKFDTINNVVSGTFSFDGSHGSDLEHVTSGYFNEIPIYFGTFGQGLITADVDGDLFTTATTTPSPSVYTVDSGRTFVITAEGDDPGTSRSLGIGIISPAVGTVILNSGTQSFADYAAVGGSRVSISTTTGATGIITITKFDWITHRMSATFYFTGYDNNTGNPVSIASGVIDNVQWFML
jgi:hypothetical protein